MSLDVYSFKIQKCKNIYPYKIIRPLNKEYVNQRRHFREALSEIARNHLRIMQFIGDNPKRSWAKFCQCHSSWYACDYCFAKGIKIEISDNVRARNKIAIQINSVQEQINVCQRDPNNPENIVELNNLFALKEQLQKSMNSLKRKSHILWPYSTMGSEHRSRQSILDIIERIERDEPLTIDERKGVLGRSPLLDVPDFNFVYDSPAEYLHLACLGVIKRLLELTFSFSGGVKRSRVTKRPLSSTGDFNKLMLCTKVTREFPRRARKLDLAVFKGQEYRNIVLFFFPLVLECIEPSEKERTVWLSLVFMLRSAVIPTSEFDSISLDIVRECCDNFYKLFEQLFGPINCTISLHVLCCHLLEIRTHGPLTETSAFKFETFYGELRRSFVPRTNSPLKQILKNTLLRRILSKHQCKNNIYITNYNTPLESNNLIYCYEEKEYNIYEVTDINEANNEVTCVKVGKYPVHFPETPNLNWSKVGVFRKGGVTSDTTEIQTSKISGKVLHVGKYLVTCPINVLLET